MSDEKKEKARQRRIGTARELEGRGFLDQAVREYVKAEAPEEAARALASVGRLADAAEAILEALGVTASEVARVPGSRREVLKQAVIFFQQTGDSTSAQAILEGLSSPPPPEPPATDSAPPGPSPGEARGSASGASKPPLRSPSAMSSGSFRAPVRAPEGEEAASAGFRPPGVSSMSSGSFRPPQRPSSAMESGSFRPPARAPEGERDRPSSAVSSGSFRMPARPPEQAGRPSSAPSSGSFRPPVRAPEGEGGRPSSALSSGSFRPPVRAPDGEGARPSSATSSGSHRSPVRAPEAGAAPPASTPQSTPEPRLSASGEVVTEYAGTREQGWRGAGDAALEESIRQLLAAGRKGAAARVAWDAGRHEQALEWFRELDLPYQAGACLRALGRTEEAIDSLLRVPTDGPHYRKACFELVPAAKALSRLDFEVDRFFTRFVEHGPQDVAEIPVFLELAELYREGQFAAGAARCVSKVLALDPKHEGALAMRAALGGRTERAQRVAAAPALERGLPELPTLEEFIALARANAPAS